VIAGSAQRSRGYARRAGFEIIGEYYDAAISGADPIEGRS
jgi:hypothetical protein